MVEIATMVAETFSFSVPESSLLSQAICRSLSPTYRRETKFS
jgi:hypothetical protein